MNKSIPITAKDLEDNGYVEFAIDRNIMPRPDRFFQKRICLDEDREYFISAYIYDFSKFDAHESIRITFQVQFNTEAIGTTFDLSVETVAWNNDVDVLWQVEDLFTDAYYFAEKRKELKKRY